MGLQKIITMKNLRFALSKTLLMTTEQFQTSSKTKQLLQKDDSDRVWSTKTMRPPATCCADEFLVKPARPVPSHSGGQQEWRSIARPTPWAPRAPATQPCHQHHTQQTLHDCRAFHQMRQISNIINFIMKESSKAT